MTNEGDAMRDRVLALGSWHDDWSGVRVAVLGLGEVGFSVADTLVELGALVRVFYGAVDRDRERLLDVIGAERFCAEAHTEQLGGLAAFGPDLVVVSPEYRPDHPLLSWAGEREIPVWGDIELGWRLRDKTPRVADWICITGASGARTTALLTAHMLVAGGLRVAPVGGVGTPILNALRDPQGYDVLVVELSAAQLAHLGEISPYASACLNVSASIGSADGSAGGLSDALAEWHGGLGAYLAAKAKVYEHTQVACVYNRADETTMRLLEEADVVDGARAISFGLDAPPPSGFGIVEEILVDRGFHATRHEEAYELVMVSELQERGIGTPWLAQCILAASALARSRGVEPAEVAAGIFAFRPDVEAGSGADPELSAKQEETGGAPGVAQTTGD